MNYATIKLVIDNLSFLSCKIQAQDYQRFDTIRIVCSGFIKSDRQFLKNIKIKICDPYLDTTIIMSNDSGYFCKVFPISNSVRNPTYKLIINEKNYNRYECYFGQYENEALAANGQVKIINLTRRKK